MSGRYQSEQEIWENFKAIIGKSELRFGDRWSKILRTDPQRLVATLSRYKFAAKMCGKGRSILELGCGEGIGVPILAEFCSQYTGVDQDELALSYAAGQWGSENRRFINANFLGKSFGNFDAVVCLKGETDTGQLNEISETFTKNFNGPAVGILGVRVSDRSLQHELRSGMERIFHNVFLFGLSDEIVQTGNLTGADYLIALGCNLR